MLINPDIQKKVILKDVNLIKIIISKRKFHQNVENMKQKFTLIQA